MWDWCLMRGRPGVTTMRLIAECPADISRRRYGSHRYPRREQALREVHRSVETDPLGHRPRRDPRPQLRFRAEIPSRWAVAGPAPALPPRRRGALHEPDPGAHLRQYVRP